MRSCMGTIILIGDNCDDILSSVGITSSKDAHQTFGILGMIGIKELAVPISGHTSESGNPAQRLAY